MQKLEEEKLNLNKLNQNKPNQKKSFDFEVIKTPLEDTETPFVNREKEAIQLLLHNAKWVLRFKRKEGKALENYRSLSFCFAAQMWGAGKTRLGEELIGLINPL